MTIETRPMTAQDIPEVLQMQLCEADVQELLAVTGETPKDALLTSIEATPEPWVVTLDGRIVAIYGVCPAPDYSFGMPWFLSTGEVSLFSKTFLKGSRKVIQRFHSEYEALSNITDSRHVVAIRWLKWLGFEFLPDPIPGHDPSAILYQFVRYQPCVNPSTSQPPP